MDPPKKHTDLPNTETLDGYDWKTRELEKNTFCQSKPTPECWIISCIAKSKKQIGVLQNCYFLHSRFQQKSRMRGSYVSEQNMFNQIRPGTASLNQGHPGSDEWKLSPKTVILDKILADYPSSHNHGSEKKWL